MPVLVACAVAAVHIHHVQSFGVLDDEVCTVLVGNGASEARLDLPCDVEVVKDGQLAAVELYDICFLGCDDGYVSLHFIEYIFVVDVDVFVTGVEYVAEHTHCAARLLVDECGELLCFLCIAQGLFPSGSQHLHLGVEFCHALALGYGAYDDAAVARFNALYGLLESCPLL